jgi:hypothetical protein
MPRKRVKKYDPVEDEASDQQIEEVTKGLDKLRSNRSPANTISGVSRMFSKMNPSKIVTAADLGRMAADVLVKQAKLTIMSQTVPATGSNIQNAHKDIMEGRGAKQTPYRYGRNKSQQPKPTAE